MENIKHPLSLYTFAGDLCAKNKSKSSVKNIILELNKRQKNDLKINLKKSAIIIINKIDQLYQHMKNEFKIWMVFLS